MTAIIIFEYAMIILVVVAALLGRYYIRTTVRIVDDEKIWPKRVDILNLIFDLGSMIGGAVTFVWVFRYVLPSHVSRSVYYGYLAMLLPIWVLGGAGLIWILTSFEYRIFLDPQRQMPRWMRRRQSDKSATAATDTTDQPTAL